MSLCLDTTIDPGLRLVGFGGASYILICSFIHVLLLGISYLFVNRSILGGPFAIIGLTNVQLQLVTLQSVH